MWRRGRLGGLKAAKAAKARAGSIALLPRLAVARIAVSRVVGVAAGLGAVQLQCDGDVPLRVLLRVLLLTHFGSEGGHGAGKRALVLIFRGALFRY